MTTRLAFVVALALSLAIFVVACGASPRVEGSACGPAENEERVCRDPWSRLSCRFFTWQVDACRGPDGCTPSGPIDARCDQRDARVGDRCMDEGGHACSVDRTELPRCDGGHMGVAAECRGSRGCEPADLRAPATCDQGPVLVGDPCEAGGHHCEADGRAVLRCTDGHRYVEERACKGARGCRRVEKIRPIDCRSKPPPPPEVVCDVSLGEVGDACDDDRATCSADGRHENVCEGGVLVRRRSCPHGCVVRWGDDAVSYVIECGDSPR